MDAVTYSNPKVAEFIQGNLIPLQVKSDTQPLATNYNVKWTPNLLVIDESGKEHHKIVGFMPDLELVPALWLGIGKARFDKDQFEEAIEAFDQVLKDYVYSAAAPEAVFFRSVSRYKSTHEAQALKEGYRQLQAQYHDSEWAKRATPYWLIGS